MKDMVGAKTAGESAMLAFDMEPAIIAVEIVSDPLAVGVDVRGVGVIGEIAEVALSALWRRHMRWRSLAHRLRTVRWNVTASHLAAVASIVLRNT